MTNKCLIFLVVTLILGGSCQSKLDAVRHDIERELSQVPGTFAVAFLDLTSGEEILIKERQNFHAASTMKTPVMIEIYKQVEAGKMALTDSVLVKNEFKSIVDGSPYKLSVADDSDSTLYDKIGQKVTLYDLMYQMIVVTSNLATNIIIELVDPKNVMQTMRELGVHDLQVRRGVEDSKAFQKGLNNTTTAYDLMVLFSKLARSEVVSKKSSESMINILLDQKFNNMIPAMLPQGVKVAHKSGFFKGVKHDSGIVILPDGRQYVLVVLSKELDDDEQGIKAIATCSKLLYDYMMSK